MMQAYFRVQSGDRDVTDLLDAEHGEYLVHPTEILSVAPIDDEFFDLIGAAYDALED